MILAVLTYLLYRFRSRRRRRVDTWDPPEKRDQSTLHRSHRQSTRSAHSIASTVFTRASNVIQIAYIPGVTVRSPPESPNLLVPPVPSLPGGTATNSAASTPQFEQHFFMPGDLRDSTWSDTSSMNRISLAPSLARQSVATTIYRSDAIVPPVPAQQAFRAQANVVSVKSGANTPGSSSTPSSRTPQIPQASKLGSGSSSIVARNVTARPYEVKKAGSASRVPTLGNLVKEAARKSPTATSDTNSVTVYDDEKEVVASTAASTPNTIIDETPISPITIPRPAFANNYSARSSGISAILPSEAHKGASSNGPTHRHSNSATLNAMIEDAINRARDPQIMHVASPTVRPELVKHDSGPFSDANEVKENLS